MTPETLEELLAQTETALKELLREPPFDFEVSFAANYEDLLSGRASDATAEPGALIDAARDAGRLLLAAEGGAGKTTVAARVVEHGAQSGLAAVRVDLRRWSPEVHEEWKRLRGSDTRRMDLLLERLADVPVRERRLRRLGEEQGALVVVDGLNEVPPSATRELLWVVDAFAVRCPWASAIVCDRLQRRPLPSGNWALATISHVRRRDEIGGPDNALLLDLTGTAHEGAYNEAAILREHLTDAASLEPDELRALDVTCLSLYRSYKEGQGRFFETVALIDGAGVDVTERLLASGELEQEDGRAYFRHHLFHDALAAGGIARDRELWTRDWLDALTFAASSFDAAALALELIDDADTADAFVTAVYDWSLYGAAYIVSQGRRHNSIHVSDSTELAMLAVLAERRWDPVAPSVQRIEDALRVWPSPLAEALLEAHDLDEVIALVSEHADDRARETWLPLFAADVDTGALLDALASGPLPGWIASNVLRRDGLDAQARPAVLDALGSPDKTVRWRAAHTLGADQSDEAVAALLRILDDRDEWHWARYGAVRALVELAGRDDARRQRVLAALQERLDMLAEEEMVFRELQDALRLREPPHGWATDVAPLIEQLFARAGSVSEQDHWRRVGHRITESVLVARAAQAA